MEPTENVLVPDWQEWVRAEWNKWIHIINGKFLAIHVSLTKMRIFSLIYSTKEHNSS